MTSKERQRLMDSLTEEQRKGIARIIRNADVEYTYAQNPETDDSVAVADTERTLACLASYFETYDPESVTE